MAENDDKTCVVFRSTLFNSTWPNQELAVETAAELGRDCADFLARQLGRRELITQVSDVRQSDWGWYFRVTIDEERYIIFVMGGGGPHTAGWWTVQVSPPGYFLWLFRKPRTHCRELVELVADVLDGTEEIDEITWMTGDEYLRMNDPTRTG